MSDVLSYGERGLAWIFRQHFRIPPPVFWVFALGGVAVTPFLPLEVALVSVTVGVAGIWGVLRWRWHRRATGLVVIAQPVTVDPADRLAVRAQELLMEGLASRLTQDERRLVHPIPARVGPTDLQLADAIRRRLGAAMIVVGRIDPRGDGGWSLFSGLVKAPDGQVIHLDWHTRDRLPARAPWDVWIDRFTPTRDVQDVQEPLLMTGEIEAIVRAFAGYVASLAGDFERAERELRVAINRSGDSESAAVDDIRCELAKILMTIERRDDALDLLRQRARRTAPSPELLRTLAQLLSTQPGDFIGDYAAETPGDGAEALDALRTAADVRADPKRPMTLYNISALTSDEGEEERTLAEAMAASRYYRKAWYARRTCGANHWRAANRARAAGDTQRAQAEFQLAARFYSAAIRARPRLRLWYWDSTLMAIRPVKWFWSSPVLHANAADAHLAAGNRARGRWHNWRADRGRSRRFKTGESLFNRQQWSGAYANYDFAVIGRADFPEACAAVMRAVSLKQLGQDEAADLDFAQSDARFPAWAPVIRLAASQRFPPGGVPGSGALDEQGVRRELQRRGFVDDTV